MKNILFMNALIFILLETNFWVCFGVPITAAADDHMSVSECTDVVLSADCDDQSQTSDQP